MSRIIDPAAAAAGLMALVQASGVNLGDAKEATFTVDGDSITVDLTVPIVTKQD